MAGRRTARRDRAQTGFDFLVGMSLFLLTVGVVFNFVPGMFEPFDTGTGPDVVGADRGAARLAEDLLVEDLHRPGDLNETCTAEFFDGGAAPAACRFDETADDLHAALGLEDTTGVNVTIESNDSIVTVDGVTAAAGRTAPSNRDRVAAQRVVLVDGDQATLSVRVW